MKPEQFKKVIEKKESDLRRIILEKESKGTDATVEKIELIEILYNIGYTLEEKEKFDIWKEKIPCSSFENPIHIKQTTDILEYLPNVPNYTKKEIIITFQVEEGINQEKLDAFFGEFCKKDPSFEISTIIFSKDILTVAIGSKTRGQCNMTGGQYYGHSHPVLKFPSENKEKLPKAFVSGILPSPGDIRGSFKHFRMIEDGTKIFSKYGNSEIKFNRKISDSEIENKLSDYKNVYFNMCLGEDGFLNDEEIKKYFNDAFSVDIRFNYVENSEVV